MRIGVFASGDGSNFEALALRHPVAFLVCDQKDAGALKRAERLGIKTFLVERTGTREEHEDKIWETISNENFSLLCLAGWKRLLTEKFLQRMPKGSVLNIHPSLLPKYPGLKGYEESFESNDEQGGITVHEVDGGMDTGRILAQATFTKVKGETLSEFKARGLGIEHELYSQVVTQVLSTPYLHRIEVIPAAGDLLESPLMMQGRVAYVKTQGPCAQLARIARDQFSDPVSEKMFWSFGSDYESHLFKLGFAPSCLERTFLPGVTDNAGASMQEAWMLHPMATAAQVKSGEAWRGMPQFPVMNPLLQTEKNVFNAFENIEWKEVKSYTQTPRVIDLNVADDVLLKLNQENWWALTLPELQLARDYFKTRGTPATDVEMEVIAQTWSEHCKHKIFRANIEFHDETTGESKTVRSLFKTFIKGVTDEVKKERGLDWLVSVFDDNAGVVRWDEKLDVAIKVETHNSPSALDPYGGALTGILGVNRDILGVGMGARPVANTNVFCLAPHDLDQKMGEAWPSGVMSPARIREGVHAGVKDGGNKSGIPTVNGAFHYDVNFAGKPLVYCGTLGVMPREVNGRPSSEKPVRTGDYVVMVGGRIGKDGLHGATFSSMEWKDGTPASVVQIGDPLTQKRVMDFILEARDLGLYSGITDNGAGGLSSSIGEMAQFTGGAEIDLALAPVKYPGLSAWELMVSESQERMTVSVPVQSFDSFMHLASLRGVEATKLGTFTTSGELHVMYQSETVARLPLSFLHEGLPPMELKARLPKEKLWEDWCASPEPKMDYTDAKSALLTMLSHANIRSHEKWVRAYDHEVQAASAMKSFSTHGMPSDAGVIALKPHGGGDKAAVVVGCGLAPQVSRLDPYAMGVWAVDEAVRNTICAGGDPARMAMVDNFCWPDPVLSETNPDGDIKLAMLVKTCEGMADACKAYGLPLVSGKDSMKNDAKVKVKGAPVKISALPTLLMTCMAHHEDVTKVIPSAPYESGLDVILLHTGIETTTLTLSDKFKVNVAAPQSGDLKELAAHYSAIHEWMKSGLIHSAHDVGEGGMMTAAAEMAMGEIGIKLNVKEDKDFFFGEAPGQILVTVRPEHRAHFAAHTYLGVTTPQAGLTWENNSITSKELKSAYQGVKA